MKRRLWICLLALLVSFACCASAFAAEAPSGYTTDSNEIMAYGEIKTSARFGCDVAQDAKGYVNGSWRQTTFSDGGYNFGTVEQYSDIGITLTQSFMESGKILVFKAKYTNNSSSIRTFQPLVMADTEVNGNDSSTNTPNAAHTILTMTYNGVGFYAFSLTGGFYIYPTRYGKLSLHDPAQIPEITEECDSAFVGYWNSLTLAPGASRTYRFAVCIADSSLDIEALVASLCYVSYDSGKSTTGVEPVDDNDYQKNDTVTVLGNIGNLSSAGEIFTGWNTEEDGSGTAYQPGDTFQIQSGVTLYAQFKAHDWVTEKEGTDTITLTCQHEGTCDYDKDNPLKLTVKDTKSEEGDVTGIEIENKDMAELLGIDIEVAYYDENGNAVDGVPTEKGTYQAVVKVGDQTVTKTLTIVHKHVWNFTYDVDYNAITVTCTAEGHEGQASYSLRIDADNIGLRSEPYDRAVLSGDTEAFAAEVGELEIYYGSSSESFTKVPPTSAGYYYALVYLTSDHVIDEGKVIFDEFYIWPREIKESGSTSFMDGHATKDLVIKIGTEGDELTKDDLTGVSLDGVLLTKDVDYTVETGCIIITIPKANLNKLPVGSYVATVSYYDSIVGDTCTYNAPITVTPYVATGDATNVTLLAVLLAVGVIGVAILRRKQRI